MAENLKAFENLKETTTGSLDQKEKTALNNLKEADIRAEKDSIWNKTFNVDWTSMKLKDIVSKLKFDSAWTEATLNWKKIARQSELWAAIQVYVIAYNKDVGKFLIDGKVWKDTIKGIEGTQTDMKTESKNKNKEQTESEYKWELIWTKDIKNKPFTKAFNSLWTGVTATYKSNWVMDGDWYLLGVNNISGATDSCKVTYKRANWESKTVDVKLGKNADDLVNTKTLAQNIKKAVEKNEDKLKLEERIKAVTDGINNYPETSISDPIVKKWFKHKNPDFKFQKSYEKDGKRYAVIKNVKDKEWKRIERHISFDKILDGNWKYSVWKYAWALVDIYKNQAIAYAKSELNKANEVAHGAGGIDNKISWYKWVIDEINSYGKDKDKFNAEKQEAVKQKNYREAVNKVNDVKVKINKTTDFDEQLKQLKRIVYVEIKPNVATKVSYNNNFEDNYTNVGKKDEYVREVSQLAKKVLRAGYVEVGK